MLQEKMTLNLLRLLADSWIGHVVSLDVESDTRSGLFLRDEYLLGISLAVRTSGSLTTIPGIKVKLFVTRAEEEAAEVELLEGVNEWLGGIRPLGVLGYCSRGYDIPLLVSKREKHRNRFAHPPWKLIDLLEQAVPVDLFFVLKTKYKLRTLAEAIDSPRFAHLPFRRQKHLVSKSGDQKANDIYALWKDDQRSFREYAEGDALNVLLIAEHIIKTGDYDLSLE
jgi:hypothetical protein